MAERIPIPKAPPARYKLAKVNLSKFLNPGVSERIEKEGFAPVALMFIKEIKENKDGKEEIKDISLLTLSYENSKDAKEKIVVVNGEDTENFRQLVDDLERIGSNDTTD